MCLQGIDTINRLWSINPDEDKQRMARHLFEYITYDLDKQQIVDFRLKPWADQFLMLRVGLYMQKSEDDFALFHDNPVVPTGRRTYPRYFKLEFAFNRAKFYARPRRIDPAKVELQAQVIELRSRGWSFPAIAKFLDISVGTAWNMANHNS